LTALLSFSFQSLWQKRISRTAPTNKRHSQLCTYWFQRRRNNELFDTTATATNPKLVPKCLVCGTNRHINLRGMGIYLRRVSAENKIIRGPLCGEKAKLLRCHLQMQRNVCGLALCSRGAHAKWVGRSLAPARPVIHPLTRLRLCRKANLCAQKWAGGVFGRFIAFVTAKGSRSGHPTPNPPQWTCESSFWRRLKAKSAANFALIVETIDQYSIQTR
jgi:hypothetical protein